MDRETRIQLANSLCTAAGCTEKVRKIHFHQIVNNNWHPHPPQAFKTWWKTHPESHWTDVTKAFNCSLYQEQFKAAHSQAA